MRIAPRRADGISILAMPFDPKIMIAEINRQPDGEGKLADVMVDIDTRDRLLYSHGSYTITVGSEDIKVKVKRYDTYRFGSYNSASGEVRLSMVGRRVITKWKGASQTGRDDAYRQYDVALRGDVQTSGFEEVVRGRIIREGETSTWEHQRGWDEVDVPGVGRYFFWHDPDRLK